jgi:hypothetical protein
VKLFKHAPSVYLDRSRAGTQLIGDRLCGQPGHQQIEHLAFARRKGGEQRPRRRRFCLDLLAAFALLQRSAHRAKKRLVFNGFSRKSTAPAFIAASHGYIPLPRHNDNR